MIRFPLSVANPFLPQGTASLSGVLNGEMDITGDMANPTFDGYINFDTTAVKVTMLGTSFTFSDEKIPVDSNVITFKDFNILACNANPLSLNGTVDARHLTDLRLDLDMAARNIQVVKSDRARGGADVYGKAFLDFFAGVKGNMQRLNVNADISLLEGTNVTYVMPDAEQTISGQSDQDMVHFIQFNDTTSTRSADSIASTAMSLNLNADLHLREGATVKCRPVVKRQQPCADNALGRSRLLHVASQRLAPHRTCQYQQWICTLHTAADERENFAFKDGSYIALTAT